MATLDNGFLKLKRGKKKTIGASINRNAKLLMVIVAASHKYEIDAKEARSSCSVLGVGRVERGLFLKMKIITAILKFPDY